MVGSGVLGGPVTLDSLEFKKMEPNGCGRLV